MNGVASWHFDEYERLTIKFAMMYIDAQSRFHGICTHRNQQTVKNSHLFR